MNILYVFTLRFLVVSCQSLLLRQIIEQYVRFQIFHGRLESYTHTKIPNVLEIYLNIFMNNCKQCNHSFKQQQQQQQQKQQQQQHAASNCYLSLSCLVAPTTSIKYHIYSFLLVAVLFLDV